MTVKTKKQNKGKPKTEWLRLKTFTKGTFNKMINPRLKITSFC